MRGQLLLFVAGFAVAVQATAGCSSSESHAPFANNSCTTPPCSTPSLVSGVASTGGAGGTDGGIRNVPDASALLCIPDLTTGIVLCRRAPGCDFTLDATLFPSCGFIPSSSGFDLECVCTAMTPSATQTSLGPQVCPLIAMAQTCAAVENQIASTMSQTDLCNKATTSAMGTSNCRDPNTIVQSGAGGMGSCSQACLQLCGAGLDPQCVMNMHCCVNP